MKPGEFRPSLDEVKAIYASNADINCIPVYTEIEGDLITPTAAFARLVKPDEPSFLLESVQGSEHPDRYCFVGIGGFAVRNMLVYFLGSLN